MATISNKLADIVDVSIEIATPASSDESFNNILLVVEAPEEEGDTEVGENPITITCLSDLTEYGYTSSEQAYIMASVVFAQSPQPDEVYVIVRQTSNGEYEDIDDTLDRAYTYGGWYGIALSKTFLDADTILAVATWTESNEKLFGFTYVDDELPITSTNFYRTYAVYGGGVPDYDETPDVNYYISLALMAKCFGYDPGSETWALKALATVNPCKLSSSMKTYCDGVYVTYFTTYASKNITSAMGGKVLANEWIDTIRFRDWLRNDIQERVFNLLVLNTKVPFTDEGITAVEGKIEESLKKGQMVGGIAPTEYDDDGNEIPGYTITVPLSSDLTDSEKASRQLTGVKFTAKLAGAIHAVEITGNLVYA